MINKEKLTNILEKEYEEKKNKLLSDIEIFYNNKEYKKNRSIELFELILNTERSIIFNIFNYIGFISNPPKFHQNEMDTLDFLLYFINEYVNGSSKETLTVRHQRLNTVNGRFEITELNTPDTFSFLSRPKYEEVNGDIITNDPLLKDVDDYINLINDEIIKYNTKLSLAEKFAEGEEIIENKLKFEYF